MKKLSVALMIILFITLAACSGQGEETSSDTQSIIGITWQWDAFKDSAGTNDVDVANPENYTLTLNEDGTASIQADCNQVTWTYELEGSQLSFNTLGPSTLAMCPEDSLDTVYLQRLGETATYVTADGNLVLNLTADAGNMEFSPQ
jgi:heat shock protein HslJ